MSMIGLLYGMFAKSHRVVCLGLISLFAGGSIIMAQQADRSSASLATFESESMNGSILALPERSGGRHPLTQGVAVSSFRAHVFLNTKGSYDDNVFHTPDRKVSDFIWNVSPGLTIGNVNAEDEHTPVNQLYLRYSPTFVVFTDQKAADSVEQDALFDYARSFGKLDLKAEQTYRHLTGNQEESGVRINRDLYNTQLNLGYEWSEKTRIEGALQQNIEDYPSAFGSKEWSAAGFVVYQLDAKIRLGPGLRLGYLDVDHSPNHYFQQLLAKVAYEASEKLHFSLDGGLDLREYSEGEKDARVSGVFHGDVDYLLSDATTLGAGIYREIRNSSLFADQNLTKTGVSVQGRQRVVQKVNLGLRLGYEHDDYERNQQPQIQDVRHDDYGFVRGSVAVDVTPWWGVELFAIYRDRDSSIHQFDYENQEIGLESRMNF